MSSRRPVAHLDVPISSPSGSTPPRSSPGMSNTPSPAFRRSTTANNNNHNRRRPRATSTNTGDHNLIPDDGSAVSSVGSSSVAGRGPQPPIHSFSSVGAGGYDRDAVNHFIGTMSRLGPADWRAKIAALETLVEHAACASAASSKKKDEEEEEEEQGREQEEMGSLTLSLSHSRSNDQDDQEGSQAKPPHTNTASTVDCGSSVGSFSYRATNPSGDAYSVTSFSSNLGGGGGSVSSRRSLREDPSSSPQAMAARRRAHYQRRGLGPRPRPHGTTTSSSRTGTTSSSNLPWHTDPVALRRLAPTLRSLLSDLRSQVVKSACANLSALAVHVGDAARLLLRDVLADILKIHGQTVKVMHRYAMQAMLVIIQHVKFFSVSSGTSPIRRTSPPPRAPMGAALHSGRSGGGAALDTLVEGALKNKSKEVRWACVRYLREILACWPGEYLERDSRVLGTTLAKALMDSSPQVRAEAKVAFVEGYRGVFPELWREIVSPSSSMSSPSARGTSSWAYGGSGSGGSAGILTDPRLIKSLLASAAEADAKHAGEETPRRSKGIHRTPPSVSSASSLHSSPSVKRSGGGRPPSSSSRHGTPRSGSGSGGRNHESPHRAGNPNGSMYHTPPTSKTRHKSNGGGAAVKNPFLAASGNLSMDEHMKLSAQRRHRANGGSVQDDAEEDFHVNTVLQFGTEEEDDGFTQTPPKQLHPRARYGGKEETPLDAVARRRMSSARLQRRIRQSIVTAAVAAAAAVKAPPTILEEDGLPTTVVEEEKTPVSSDGVRTPLQEEEEEEEDILTAEDDKQVKEKKEENVPNAAQASAAQHVECIGNEILEQHKRHIDALMSILEAENAAMEEFELKLLTSGGGQSTTATDGNGLSPTPLGEEDVLTYFEKVIAFLDQRMDSQHEMSLALDKISSGEEEEAEAVEEKHA